MISCDNSMLRKFSNPELIQNGRESGDSHDSLADRSKTGGHCSSVFMAGKTQKHNTTPEEPSAFPVGSVAR